MNLVLHLHLEKVILSIKALLKVFRLGFGVPYVSSWH
jgi:hypothetical protein